MHRTGFVMMALAVVSLSACSNPDRFGGTANGTYDAGNAGVVAPAPAPVPTGPAPSSPAYFSQTIGDRVLFLVDQSTLTDSARQTLSAQARWLTQNPEYTAIIEGHADEQGTREYNLALGARRAASVRDYLVSQGVSAGRMRTLTFGKERPIEICSTEACYAKNRRAVTVIAAGGLTG
ncbi:peptidoglycan-associated lipoprotein Pal [Palleronia caenipelagi]|uniref:Peptidoglycan-associated lipoprotein n=1 Tax=Palleronia caenipelagi TaxID=2489174 RepID=A0A547Q5K0_9RHOB|nr:peptidoglycan-associated lipoprotein Pal [Palleronia caenipelagi]TRD21665.1 peptidoglycan-associated lipoprotein Pal [Palleronia caenipelagi]